MSMNPALRAGDEDRDRTIARLREAFAEGRLTQDEFDTRMGKATAARTYGDLDALTDDLPAAPSVRTASASSVPAPASGEPEDESRSLRAGWAAWAGVSVLVNVIWFATWLTDVDGGIPYYWPIWVMGPWGAAMLIGTLNRRRD